jgi:prepilin-type N-terminal cleavage/methylation domain-containing protein
MGRRFSSRSGLTLLELLLAVVILAMIGAKVFQMLAQTSDVMSTQERETVLDDQANSVLKMIAYNIMASDRDTLAPAAVAPLTTDDIRYRVNLGLQDGAVVWKDPEEIGQDDADNDVYWRENPDAESERRVVWTRAVAPFLEGEIPDGMDNNGNGLIDEKGLSWRSRRPTGPG